VLSGGGGWMTGTYDQTTNTLYWGTANPAPDYDLARRPGDNLYTSGVIALDPDSGALKSFFQEVPHDSWDFDGAVGEFVMLDRGGQRYVVHPNKGGDISAEDQCGSPDRATEARYQFPL
jgi:alcohol dehydrogenase (cytochrome c)